MLSHILCICLLFNTFLLASSSNPTVTIITAYWDVGRGNLQSHFKRSNNYYWGYFETLLKIEANLIIFGDATLQKMVQQKRNPKNTVFILRDLSEFYERWYTKMILQIIQGLRRRQDWYKYWKYPQFGLNMYNPVVMSKLFLMDEAIDIDPFNSDFYVWADGGLMHNYAKFEHLYKKDSVLEIQHHFSQIPWYFHVYLDENIFRGYKRGEKPYTNEIVSFNQVVWANYFGGRIEMVSTLKSVYENILRITFQNGDMGTDQSVFSIMLVRFPYLLPVVSDFELYFLKEVIQVQSKQHYQTNENHHLFMIKRDGSIQVEFIRQIRNKGNLTKRYLMLDDSVFYQGSYQGRNVSLIEQLSSANPTVGNDELIHSPQISQLTLKYKKVLLHRLIFAISLVALFFQTSRFINRVKVSLQL